jgi:hypothetical protein
VLRLCLLGAGLTVLAIVLHAMGVREVVAMARRSGWAIVWMIGLYAVHVATRAWVIWRNLPAPRLSLVETLRIRFAAEAIEMLTFTGPFLAEPAKGWMFVRRGIPAAQAAGVIAFEYVTYMLVASWLALAGLAVLLRRNAFPPGVHGAIVALVIGLALFVVGVIGAAITGVGLLAPGVRLLRPLIGARRAASASSAVASMESHFLGILYGNRRRLAEALIVQFAGHALLVVEIVVLFRALGYQSRAADPWIVEGGVKFINAAFVFVPGQLGAAEGANAIIVAALGYPATVGVTLSLLRRLRAYIVAAPGLALTTPPPGGASR